jgi:hypothetical protein
MLKQLDLKYTAAGFVIAAIIGALIYWFSGLPFWVSFTIVVVALLLNGILAEYEDNLPGGFNNPMSENEIKAEKQKRKKRLLPIRLAIWGVFIGILIGLVWLYLSKGV